MLTVLLAWIAADFLSGLGHWYEDKIIINPQKNKFIEEIRRDNISHHSYPGKIVGSSLIGNISTTAPVTLPAAFLLFIFNAPAVLTLAIFFVTFANIVHRWAHVPSRHLNPLVRCLQKVGLFQSFKHHHGHHYRTRPGDVNRNVLSKEESREKWCVMTNYLNPVLDTIKFFPVLEVVVLKLGLYPGKTLPSKD